jgi:hypothetical protein
MPEFYRKAYKEKPIILMQEEAKNSPKFNKI